MGAPRWKRRDQPHSPTVDGSKPVSLRRNSGAVEAPAQGYDARVGVCQYEDRLSTGMASDGLSDQVGLAAARRRGHRAPVDCQEINLIRWHYLPT